MPTVTVVGAADLSHSIVSVATSSLQSGGTTTITLTAKDANGSQETKGGLAVVFSLGTGAGRGTFSSVTDHGNGTYTATFTGTTAGSNTIKATIGGQAITSTAPVLTVVGAADLSHSIVSVATPSVQSTKTTTITLTAKDANGNQETKGDGGCLRPGIGVGHGTFSSVRITAAAPTPRRSRYRSAPIRSASIGDDVLQSPGITVTVGPADRLVPQSLLHPRRSKRERDNSRNHRQGCGGNQETVGGSTVVFSLGTGTAELQHGDRPWQWDLYRNLHRHDHRLNNITAKIDE